MVPHTASHSRRPDARVMSACKTSPLWSIQQPDVSKKCSCRARTPLFSPSDHLDCLLRFSYDTYLGNWSGCGCVEVLSDRRELRPGVRFLRAGAVQVTLNVDIHRECKVRKKYARIREFCVQLEGAQRCQRNAVAVQHIDRRAF